MYCPGVLLILRRRSWPIQRPSGVLEAVPAARPLPHEYAIAATHRQDAIAATVARTGALEAGAGAVPAAPEVWSAPDHVAGADRDLGPVRESWAVVRGDADVALVCRLAPQRRPLVRARSARFRVAALDATRFHARGLAAAAAAASDAGWRVVDGGRDDAASHAAAKQLANAAAFLDVERAVERVFGSSSSAAAEEGGSGWFVF